MQQLPRHAGAKKSERGVTKDCPEHSCICLVNHNSNIMQPLPRWLLVSTTCLIQTFLLLSCSGRPDCDGAPSASAIVEIKKINAWCKAIDDRLGDLHPNDVPAFLEKKKQLLHQLGEILESLRCASSIEQQPSPGRSVSGQLNALAWESADADFQADPTSGMAPLRVQFTDTSKIVAKRRFERIENATESWEWDLDGDNLVDSTATNPVFTYVSPGTYSVRLQIKGGFGTSTTTLTDAINANAPTHKNSSGHDVAYADWQLLETNQRSWGLFGVGPDGHLNYHCESCRRTWMQSGLMDNSHAYRKL
jgi:hypothetical protein